MLLRVRKFSYKKVLKTGFILLLVAVITIGSFQPETTFRILANIVGQQPKNPSVLEAPKVDMTPTLLSSESVSTVATSPVATSYSSDTSIDYELVDKRTEFSSTFVNKDGSKTLRHSLEQQNYKEGGVWKKIDNTLNSTNREEPFGNDLLTLKQGTSVGAKSEFKGKAGKLTTTMKSSVSGLEIQVGDKTLIMTPVGAKNVLPEKDDDHSVVYKDVWPNVDLRYELRGENVKEVIVLKSREARTSFDFKVTGGKVINHPTKEGYLTVEGLPEEFSFSQLTLDVNGQGIYSWPPLTQEPTKDGIRITLDNKWAKSQPKSSFPMAIDPSFGREATNWMMYKSDGYSCNGSVCYANTGTLYNSGWKHWRTYFHFPYSDLAGKRILAASFYGVFQHNKGGTGDGRWLNITHANCLGFHCTGPYAGSAVVGTDFRINFAERLQEAVNAGNYGAWWSINGEEGPYMSFKPYYTVYADVVYDTPTPVATPASPSNGQVVVTSEANTLRVNPVGDADGDAVQYYFRVATGSNAESGAVINSDWISASQWTIPDGILQDGTTYYWHVYTRGATQTNPNWVNSFKVDLRTGKDSTQAYDTFGAFGADLATGNLTTDSTTHAMSALGGDIGLSLNYNTTAKVNGGLVGEYWNVSSGYSFASGAPGATPNLTRNDQDINFDWSSSSPGPGVNADWFYARWKGNFVAPTTGTYNFGATIDDNVAVYVNNQKVFEGGCCGGPIYTNSTGVSLQAGQVVPIRVEFLEAVGAGYVKLYAKNAVPEQIVPKNWLRTEVQPALSQYGLMGRYYKDDPTHTLPVNAYDSDRLLMARVDSKLTFSWPDGVAPAAGLPSDFMTRWTGYITVPTSGSYQLRVNSDDGVRIRTGTGAGGADQTILDNWGYTADDRYATAVNLVQGAPTRITIDFFDGGGPGGFTLKVNGGGVNGEIPVKWLSPKANVLPDTWRLGVDVDGNVGYERLRVMPNSIVLEDSTRSTHEYKWTGSGYTPPVGETGVLIRSADNTYSLQDVDGRMYIFDAEGKLKSVTSPVDDRSPVSLRYEYAGDPSRLVKIIDGVNSQRFGTLHYQSINEDGNCQVPSGFDQAPSGMLCAFKTTDENVTRFYYKAGHLARVEKPGQEITDYGYDTFGRIVSSRTPLANDAISANIVPDDANALTNLTYNLLGRVESIKLPRASAGQDRITKTITYGLGTTKLNIVGASEPHGFSQKVDYDTLLRTTVLRNSANIATTTEWDATKDLVLSQTDPTGLKTTKIYDSEDREIESYGPAPSGWFGSDRKPLASYVSQVPKTSSQYDQGINGLAVAYMHASTPTGSATPVLTGSPLLNATNIATDGTISRNYGSVDPIAGHSGSWGMRMSGKLILPTTGTWNFRLSTDNGARVWINNAVALDSWSGGSERSRTFTYNNTTSNKPLSVVIDYYHVAGVDATFKLFMTAPGGSETNQVAQYFTPNYGLSTTQTVHDTQLGNTVTTTNYDKPEYGLPSKQTVDPSGLNLQTIGTYEAPGTGYLRQNSSTLPGGTTVQYQYYSGIETRDNPCTSTIESFKQAGKEKVRIEPDPDDVGSLLSRTNETVYNESGYIVAQRYNQDDWTCTTYDARGRITEVSIAAIGTASSRTVHTNYAADGNPLKKRITDSNGSITIEADLVGRAVGYTDSRGNSTVTSYDTFGRVLSKTSPVGIESYTYDSYDRPVTYKLDGVTFATVTYDTYGRIETVSYPAGISLKPAVRDTLGRVSKLSYEVSSQLISDEISRSTSGYIINGTENGIQKQYSYDKASRLTGATIGSSSYAYEYGALDASCDSLPGNNSNANKNSNRTKLIVNGQVTTYCYNQADQLIDSSDARFSDAVYDAHGNTLSLGDSGSRTEFTYDSSDRNIGILETTGSGTKEIQYSRDASNRIVSRTYKTNGATDGTSYYGYNGMSDTPGFVTDQNGTVVQKYLSLPGGVIATVNPQSTSAGALTYSLPNIRGDVMATVNADGALIATHVTGPFGEKLSSYATPNNTLEGASWGNLGRFQRTTESSLIASPVQMGARVYIPELGRFLQVDPEQGGALNAYVYAADPVNQYDINGKWVFLIPIIVSIVRIIAAAAPAIVTAVKVATTATKATSTATKVTKAASTSKQVVTSAKAASNARGTYQFTTTSNQTYSGMSNTNIGARLNSHATRGVYQPGTPVSVTRMPNATKLDIRVQEQMMINKSGGIGDPYVANQINSIAPKYWDDLGL